MTKKRYDSHSTEFGLWLREQGDLDSSLGYVATNLDYIWRNYKSGLWMCIEEKRYGHQDTEPRPFQRESFKIVHGCATSDDKYCGFYLIVFENTSPDDGLLWINHQLATKEQLIRLLQFGWYPDKKEAPRHASHLAPSPDVAEKRGRVE